MQAASPIILGLTAPITLAGGPLAALATASVAGLTNLCWLLPKTRKIKEERKGLQSRLTGEELESFDGPLRKKFGKFHGLSLLFNLTNACSMLVYGVYLCKGLLKHVPK